MINDTVLSLLQIGAALVTATATGVLCYFTFVLARETKAMSERASEPHVVVSLEPNRWSINYFDMHIANTGNAAAHDVELTFSPPIEQDQSLSAISKVSVLRPGQKLSCSVGSYEVFADKVFDVTVEWRRKPDMPRETVTYQLNMGNFEGYGQLGGDPFIKLVQAVEKIERKLQR